MLHTVDTEPSNVMQINPFLVVPKFSRVPGIHLDLASTWCLLFRTDRPQLLYCPFLSVCACCWRLHTNSADHWVQPLVLAADVLQLLKLEPPAICTFMPFMSLNFLYPNSLIGPQPCGEASVCNKTLCIPWVIFLSDCIALSIHQLMSAPASADRTIGASKSPACALRAVAFFSSTCL